MAKNDFVPKFFPHRFWQHRFPSYSKEKKLYISMVKNLKKKKKKKKGLQFILDDRGFLGFMDAE